MVGANYHGFVMENVLMKGHSGVAIVVVWRLEGVDWEMRGGFTQVWPLRWR